MTAAERRARIAATLDESHKHVREAQWALGRARNPVPGRGCGEVALAQAQALTAIALMLQGTGWLLHAEATGGA